MDLDALMARSQAPGQFVERKSFTLSRGKAMSKMQEFTLRDPEQFGLELIQAGVFAGASWVFADADKHQATIGWVGGRSLTQDELDGLLDYLFISEGASDARHLRQLAVAVNVLMRRKPLVLRIESGDGESAVRLDLEADGTGVVGIPAEQIFGTYLHVRFSKPWFFETKTRSKAAELIESNCLYSPVPVFVNGDGPHGWDRSLPLSNPMLHDECAFRGEGRDGWIGKPIYTSHIPPHVKLVVGGVVVSRRQIPELGDNIEGVIRDDRLAKTADMSDIVADDNWNRMLHHLQPLVVDTVHSRIDTGWVPPELPPLAKVSDPSDDEPAPVDVQPLSEGLTLLGTTTLLPTGSLPLFADEPLYWVDSTEALEVGATLSDAGFMGRVVVVEDTQRQAFADLLAGAHANRIRPEDAAFVAAQAAKAVEVRSISVSTRIGVLHLHLHLRGRLPGWRTNPAGIPLMVVHPRGRRDVHTLVLRLPRVSAVLELDGDVDVETAAVEAVHVLERHVWELALQVDDPTLTRALLHQALFLQPTDDGPVPGLPSAWPAEALALLDLPLAPEGPSANAVLAVLGTPEVVEVPVDTEAVAAFADRFGPGHITGPGRMPRPLLVIQWDGAQWTQVDHALPDVAHAVILVMDQFVASGPNAEATPHPLFVAGRRDPDATVDFETGYRFLAGLLRGALLGGLPTAEQQLLHLAQLVLDGADTRFSTGRTDEQGVSYEILAGQIASGAERVGLRGGLTRDGVGRTLCSVDQLALIGGTPAFLLDDPPELWAPEPDPADWLVTLPIIEPGLEGWIGLRFPYDPTGGLLLQQGLSTRIVDEIEHGVRFHGRLTHTHHDDVLPAIVDHCTEVLVALLALSELDDEREATVQRYAADFAAIARLHPECGIPDALAERLARRVPVGDWGDLHAWLQAPADHRPALELAVAGLTGDPIDPDAELLTESSGSLVLDAMRLTLGRAGVSNKTTLFVNPDGWHTAVWDSGTLSISFGGRSRVLRLADEGHRRALGLTLLDAVRRLHAFEASTGVADLDLLALQRAALEATEHVAR